MEENNKNIDKFIKQNLIMEETSFDFSDTVMKQIYTSSIKKEKTLSSLLKKNIIKKTSINFTSNVLSTIKQNSKEVIYQPVISKKA